MSLVKIVSYPFYRFKVSWQSDRQYESIDDVKLIVLLNHTSLYEALFVRLASFRYLWKMARHFLIPVADVTTQRPMVGFFFHALLPGIVSISRKRDDSWQKFLSKVNDDAIVAILPEGRMRRHDGKDKHGKPMSVRTGVADIVDELEGGSILFVYSGGLHHIQIPGQRFPKLFRTIKVNMELVNVDEYKQALHHTDARKRKTAYVKDIQSRLEQQLPYCEQQPYNNLKD
ncbi:MAG: 1-acyl-sn-glycerol-3-phosphate acyltransferase [Gammaproteobacteria bacterium]|nr:1-acyl-sn-glycerol-3-phosphate acyltransferase [Gammaproteobacteria bacterium]